VGKGMVSIRSSFQPSDASSQQGSVSPRPKTAERRGLLRRDRSTTPNPPA
jgi:hypothetical protein